MELDNDYTPFYRGEEIYAKFHNNLWFSRKRFENFNFLRTYKMPKEGINKKLVINNFLYFVLYLYL
jgi:hypothetical protein